MSRSNSVHSSDVWGTSALGILRPGFRGIVQLPEDQFMGNLRIQTKEYVNTPVIPHIYIAPYGLKKVLSHYHYSTDKKTRIQGS